ncbi:MAG: holo-ACP synthase [Eubacteriales bacterium]
MIIGTGIDIIEISRIKKAAKSEHFMARIFTSAEQELFESRDFRPSTIAGNFAAKEAIMKAFGCGFSSGLYRDIEILRETSGAPKAVLTGEAKRKFNALNGKAVHLSLSNLKDLVCAQAIIESE